MILLEETELKLLLEQKKQFIGKRVAWDSFLSAVSFLISVFLASYGDWLGIPGMAFKCVFVMLGIYFTCRSIYDIRWSFKNSYTAADLFHDINDLNQIAHHHSIIAIKDAFEQYPNRFLLYSDPRWSCDLFLNFKDHANNEAFIAESLSNRLHVDSSAISVTYIAQNISEKYSESHHENRVYCHRLYSVTISEFPPEMKRDTFEIDGTRYKWMSIADMERDTRILEVNDDVVQFVKNNCS